MKAIHCLVKFVVSILLFFIIQSSLYAGITGKIRGTAKDMETGEHLAGVNIIVKGTNMGAATDVKGNFTILNIHPGVYKVEARMIGYATKVQTKVQVIIDRSTNLEFLLQMSTIEGEEVTIVAERDLIQVDVSSTESIITTEQIETTPLVNRIEDMLTMQAGVSGNAEEGELSIRMADPREVLAMVDGYSLRDFKKGGSFFPVNYGVIEEIKVMRNGYNAEYGRARSGIINIVTKDPGQKFHVNLDVQYLPPQRLHSGPSVYDWRLYPDLKLRDGDSAFEGDTLTFKEGYDEYDIPWKGWNYWADKFASDANPSNDFTAEQLKEIWDYTHAPVKYDDKSGQNIDLAISGPVKILPWDNGFVVGLRYEKRPFTYPQPIDFYKNISANFKWTNQIRTNTKLTISGLHSTVSSVEDGLSQNSLESGGRLSYSGVFNIDQLFYLGAMDVVDQKTTMFGAKLTHIFSPTQYMEVSLNYHETSWEENRPPVSEAGRWFVDVDGDSTFIRNPQNGWIHPADGNKALGFDALRPKLGHDDWEQSYGSGFTWDNSWAKRYVINASYTNQFHHSHELKTGLEFMFEDMNQDRIHWNNDNPAQEMINKYHVKPYHFAGYLQDKIEFKGLVANVGLRLDTYNANSDLLNIDTLLAPAFLTQDRGAREVYRAIKNQTYPEKSSKTRVNVSPRIGVSFPISTTSKFFFNWGHFTDVPDMRRLYGIVLDGGNERVEIFPNPNLTYEKTIAYELGYDQSFGDFLQVHISAFYKDYRDNAGSVAYMNIFNSGDWLRTYENINWRDVKGVEIELRKDRGRFITGYLNWYLTKEAEADFDYRFMGSSRPVRNIEDIHLGKPQSEFSPATSRGSGVIALHTPQDWGPKLKNYSIFGGTSANIRIKYRGPELVRHPDSEFRRRHPDVRFYTIPYFSTDLRLIRQIKVMGAKCELYLDISNFLVSKYRYPPSTPVHLASGGQSGFESEIAYYDDLYKHGKTDKVGTEDVSDPKILQTWRNWGKYRGEHRIFTLGLRIKI